MMVGGTEFVIWGIEGVEGWKWGHGMEEMGVVYPGQGILSFGRGVAVLLVGV